MKHIVFCSLLFLVSCTASVDKEQANQLTIALIAHPSFAINESLLIETVTSRMVNACPNEDLFGNTGPDVCKKEITALQYFTIGKKTRLFACIGFPFEGAHADVGSNGFILMEYQNEQWVTLDFLEYQEADAAQFGEALKFNSPTILGKQAFCFYSFYDVTFAGDGPYTTLNLFGVILDKIVHFPMGGSGADSPESEIYHSTFTIVPSEKNVFDIKKVTEYESKAARTEILVYDAQKSVYSVSK
jgi:hypothetical protein